MDLNITYSGAGGIRYPDIVHAKYYVEDGLILSLCNRKSSDIARKLGKTACVRIESIEVLKRTLDECFGIVGEMAPCNYTSDHQRNHFLKSTEDAWQDEFRIFWPIQEEKTVQIPGGLAKRVKLKR